MEARAQGYHREKMACRRGAVHVGLNRFRELAPANADRQKVAVTLFAKSLARPPSKPNAVRRGVNHHTTRRPAWFARGLTAGRLSLAVHSSARIKREPYFWRQPRETTAGSMPVGDEPTNSIIL